MVTAAVSTSIQYPLGVGDGRVTRVLEQGEGERVIVCVHGVGARADRFRRNLPGLAAAGFRVLAIDLLGHGLATKGPAGYSVALWSSEVLGVLDALGIERATICGTSLGGHIAAHVACTAPQRVTGLIMAGSLGIVPLGEASRNAIADSILDRSLEGIGRKLRFVLQQTDLITPEWIREEHRINNSPGADDGFRIISDYFRHRVDDDVVGARLKSEAAGIPRLLIWGAEDRMVTPELGIASHKVLEDTPLVLMRDCGHGPYLERPEAFNQVVSNFLAGRIEGGVTETI